VGSSRSAVAPRLLQAKSNSAQFLAYFKHVLVAPYLLGVFIITLKCYAVIGAPEQSMTMDARLHGVGF